MEASEGGEHWERFNNSFALLNYVGYWREIPRNEGQIKAKSKNDRHLLYAENWITSAGSLSLALSQYLPVTPRSNIIRH